MVTAILMVVALLLVLGMAVMVYDAIWGNWLATVWVCCGGLSSVVELLGEVLKAIVEGLTSN